MVAAVASPHRSRNVKLVTEFRGAAARLFTEARGEIVISGAAGTGKTRQVLEYIHHRCSTERVRVLILRKTLESLKASALVTFQQQVLHEFDGKQSIMDGVSYFGGNTIRPSQFTYERTGAVIILGGMDRISKVLSTEYDIIYVNECTELTLEEWEQLGSRTDRPTMDVTRPPSVLLGDCNPGPASHWIKQRAKEGRLQLWPTTHRDNPAMWDRKAKAWTDAGTRYLARLDSLTGVRRQRLLEGLWVSAEGTVYQFDRDVHVIPRSPFGPTVQPSSVGAAVDWGYTHPGVITVGQVDGDKRIIVPEIVYRTGQTIDWWIATGQRLQRRYGIEWFACDPSEPAYIEQFNRAGLRAFPAQNAILPGINAVEQRLKVAGDGRPRLLFVADCLPDPDPRLLDDKKPLSTLDEFDVYVWDKSTGRKEKPVDANNHGQDTLRYLVMQVDHPQGGDFAAITDDATLAALQSMGIA